jgi:hypothetical protein|tara:strand:- start:2819 stop:3202 length:384 start_codon:yes stop_codon:yes gene_type:complete
MNFNHTFLNIEDYIINYIKSIYEILSISKSIFIIQPALFDNIYNKLNDDEFPVCTFNNFNKFENHNSRILMIKDRDFNKIFKCSNNLHFKEIVNLILFINTPRFIDNNIFNNLLSTSDLSNTNILEI